MQTSIALPNQSIVLLLIHSFTMAPVATEKLSDQTSFNGSAKIYNPFYSPAAGDEGDDDGYEHANYKVCIST